MTSHIALLRSINVGNNALKMERLRSICQDLGFADVRTYVQSGNLLFSSRDKSSQLSELIETNCWVRHASPFPSSSRPNGNGSSTATLS